MFTFNTYKPALRKTKNISYSSFVCCFSENIEDD